MRGDTGDCSGGLGRGSSEGGVALADHVMFDVLPQLLRAAHASQCSTYPASAHGAQTRTRASDCSWNALAAVARAALLGSSMGALTPARFRIELQAMHLRDSTHGELGAEMELLLAETYYAYHGVR